MNNHRPYIQSLIMSLLILTALLLQGCGNKYEEEVTENYRMTSSRLDNLKRMIDGGSIRNAILVKTYARKLATINPDLKELADALKKDGTSRGVMFQNLQNRIKQVKQKVETKKEYTASINELNNIWVASDPIIYNDALIDVINTMADLSEDKLPRISIPQSSKNNSTDSTTGKVPGSYLVGNPSYGNWKTDSSGHSFWAWYGMYSMFRNVVSPGYYHGSIGYNSWYSSPRNSYYHDYGRSSYGSSRDRSSWQSGTQRLRSKGINPAPAKNYKSLASQKRVSTYSNNRGSTSKTSSLASSSRRSSSYSSYKSSSRGTSSGSRSSYGGK